MTGSKKSGETFSSTEVGILIESLRADFRTVAEVVAPIPERLTAKERFEK